LRSGNLLWLINWLPLIVQVLGILFPYRLMQYLSHANESSKLKPNLMVLLKDIKHVLWPKDFNRLRDETLMQHLHRLHMTTVQTLIVMAASSSWTISQMDVQNTFHGHLHE
jgi:hypothetical protein